MYRYPRLYEIDGMIQLNSLDFEIRLFHYSSAVKLRFTGLLVFYRTLTERRMSHSGFLVNRLHLDHVQCEWVYILCTLYIVHARRACTMYKIINHWTRFQSVAQFYCMTRGSEYVYLQHKMITQRQNDHRRDWPFSAAVRPRDLCPVISCQGKCCRWQLSIFSARRASHPDRTRSAGWEDRGREESGGIGGGGWGFRDEGSKILTMG